jgi:hypothetical protein
VKGYVDRHMEAPGIWDPMGWRLNSTPALPSSHQYGIFVCKREQMCLLLNTKGSVGKIMVCNLSTIQVHFHTNDIPLNWGLTSMALVFEGRWCPQLHGREE